MGITDKLEQLAEIKAQKDVLQIQYNELRAKILAQVQEELNALEAEFSDPMAQIAAVEAKLDAEIRAEVLTGGVTIKSERLQAVFMKPRVTWDTSALDALVDVFPMIGEHRKIGQPSVAIRNVK